jgi:predicted CopG family antitoxin
MTAVELRNNLHTLIDELSNESVLGTIYELLLSLKNSNDSATDIWDLLTEEQREELDLAILESEDDRNFVSHEDVMKESKQWLKK